jgi:hypothetical protein
MSTSAVTSGWMRVGKVPPGALSDSKLQLHHAAQIAVSAAISYIAARPDDSHTALTWVAPLGCLATEPITATRQLRVALRVEDLTLHMLDQNESAKGSFALSGRTVAEGQRWLVEVLAQAAMDPARFTARKHYTIPAHPVATGETFSVDRRAQFEELARYWSNAAGLLDELARATEGAGAVRTWPHHFDIATLISLAGGSGKTVGVGQSPGDESYGEPYWYVGPYPYPSVTALPAIAGSGHWHTQGWVGAVLPASDYVDAPDQRSQVSAFTHSAVAACRTLLGA